MHTHTHTHIYIYIYTYTTNDAHVSASVSQDKKGGKTQSRMSVRYDMSFSLLSHLIPRIRVHTLLCEHTTG